MDLKQLEYFVRVAELGSFTRASIALGVAQPALSRQVRLLEVELRQNLLDRNGRGVELTESGKLLLEHGRGILHQVAVAREEMGDARSALAGRVSVGLPPSLSRLITVPLTRAFLDHLPRAQLTLTEGFTVQMYEGLRVGNLDVAVLYNPVRSPDFEMSTLHEEELTLIAPRQVRDARVGGLPASLSLREVAALPLILPSRPNVFRNLVDAEMARFGLRPQVMLQVDGLNAILDLVREGLGHAVLPAYTLSGFADASPFVLHAIHSPRIMSELNLVWSARRPATKTQRRAQELIRQVVAEALGDHPAARPPEAAAV